MQQNELIGIIEQMAPLSLAASWDVSGLQVASHRETVTCLAVCLEPLPALLKQALDAGADMILSHHPLTMQPRFVNKLDNYHACLSLLLRADVALYAAHTSLDANPLGVVGWLAQELGMAQAPETVLEPLGMMTYEGKQIACGFGMVGDLPEPLSPEELHARLLPWLGASCPRLSGVLPKRIRRVAICPGSGSSLAEAAAREGADVLITGDVKYHTALESPLPLLDVGHFSLEEEMMRRMARHLEGVLCGVRVVFIPSRDPLPCFAPRA